MSVGELCILIALCEFCHLLTYLLVVPVGGLQAMAELLARDCELSVSASPSDGCSAFSVTLRRYVCMTLTNLTYADSTNKSVLCAMPVVLRALVSQLRSSEEDLRQVLFDLVTCVALAVSDYMHKSDIKLGAVGLSDSHLRVL